MSEEIEHQNEASQAQWSQRRANDMRPIDAYGEKVHGTRISLRLFILSIAATAVTSFIIGGSVLPYLKFKPKIEQELKKGDMVEKDALKVSIGPQTVWASPADGVDPIATGLSVEQVLSEFEVLASQAGLLTTLEFVRAGETIEARYAFKPREKHQSFGSIISAKSDDFPKALVLTFAASPTPGAIVLKSVRENGKEQTKGATFVDLVKMGAVAPELSQGQYLTPKGIFEIRSIENGVAAFIDNKQIYPILPEKAFINIGQNKEETISEAGAPEILQLRGIQPDNAIFRERFIMVASAANGADCTSRMLIYDVPREKIEVLEHPLFKPNVAISNGKNAIIFNGFCDNLERNNNSAPVKPNNGQNYHLEAVYNLLNGAISYNRVINQAAQAPTASTSLRPIGGWRATSATRIASPIGAGAALVSLSCNPAGGMSLSLAGIPAPSDLKGARISFGGAHSNASASMRWIATAASYEISENRSAQEFRAILQSFRTDDTISVTGNGIRTNVTSPGRASIESLHAICPLGTSRTVAATSATITQPKPNPAPKTSAKTPTQSSAATSKPNTATNNNVPSFNAPKPQAQTAKPAKKLSSEAQAVNN